MPNRFILMSMVTLVGSAVASLAAAQASLPANVEADRGVVQQDIANLHSLHAQLQTDEAGGNAAVVDADRTALRVARLQLKLDLGKLHQDAQSILQPDHTALLAALTQLHTDQVANNASAVQADQTSVENAQAQLKADHRAVFGDLGLGGMHHRHSRG